jgi:hypothetical protein
VPLPQGLGALEIQRRVGEDRLHGVRGQRRRGLDAAPGTAADLDHPAIGATGGGTELEEPTEGTFATGMAKEPLQQLHALALRRGHRQSGDRGLLVPGAATDVEAALVDAVQSLDRDAAADATIFDHDRLALAQRLAGLAQAVAERLGEPVLRPESGQKLEQGRPRLRVPAGRPLAQKSPQVGQRLPDLDGVDGDRLGLFAVDEFQPARPLDRVGGHRGKDPPQRAGESLGVEYQRPSRCLGR